MPRAALLAERIRGDEGGAVAAGREGDAQRVRAAAEPALHEAGVAVGRVLDGDAHAAHGGDVH